MVLLLDFDIDEVTVLNEFTDERVDLTKRQLWVALQITANEAVFINAQFECGRAGVLDGSDAELLR